MKRILGLGTCALLAAAAFVWGQEPADPPARVARLSYMQGPVSLQPANAEEWVAATVNYPLTTGDRIWTAGNSYAELHIGAMAIHLAPHAAFTVSRLDDTTAQMALAQGTIYVRVPLLQEGETVEIDTPNGAVSLVQPGSYRIDVDVEHNATSVTVRAGEAGLIASGRTVQVLPGRMVQLVGAEEIADALDALAPDEWEQWCVARDRSAEEALAQSEDYVPADMEGAEDLAVYGEWTVDATYGAVWCPRNPGGWAPYRNGHWVYIAPWGWTWVDDAPWGFAPLHFGRWIYTQGRWMWAPGRHTQHPVYAPALVAFVGGPNVRETLAARRAPFSGWIPLAPGEPYRPPYRASTGYLRRINTGAAPELSTATGLTPTYRNRDHMIAASPATITGGRPDAGGKTAAAPPAAVWRPAISRHESPGPSKPAAVSSAPTTSESAPMPIPETRRGPAPLPVQEQRRAEPPRMDFQQAERQRAEQQRLDQQRLDQQRAEQQQAEQHRAEQRRFEQQQAEQRRAEQQRAEQQQAEQRRAEQQRLEQQRAEQQQAEQHRAEQRRFEQQQAEQRRAEQQRSEQRQAEQRRAEQQRAEQQQAEQRRAEQQREEQRRVDEVKKADDSKKKQ